MHVSRSLSRYAGSFRPSARPDREELAKVRLVAAHIIERRVAAAANRVPAAVWAAELEGAAAANEGRLAAKDIVRVQRARWRVCFGKRERFLRLWL